MKRIAVIMAGGSGERFWPLSRRQNPKQLLRLVSEDRTMIEESIERIAPMIAYEDIYIITSEVLAEPIRKVVRCLPPENIIPEPAKRNTAPCLALSASVALAKYKEHSPSEISVAVLTADQSIYPENKFIETVDAALNYAETKEMLVTIGIVPDRPETGYGYVETMDRFSANDSAEVVSVVSFREKPSLQSAVEYVESGRFLWNSGMFFWRLDTFINELKEHLPEVGNKIISMALNFGEELTESTDKLNNYISEIFASCPSISIDYGLMEKSNRVAVAKALFSWDDVGAWDALRRTKQADADGNIIIGDVSAIATNNSIIINNSSGKIITAANGLDNIAIIVTEDAVMVCPIDNVQDVKKNVEDIRSRFDGDKWL